MDFFQAIAKTAEDLQSNPVWQREVLIGQGIDPLHANVMAQKAGEDQERKQMVEMIRARLDAGQPITESELMAIGSVNPELARVIIDQQDMARKERAAQAKQEMLGQLFGGGSSSDDATRMVAAGAMYNDPQLMALGTFVQDQANRREDEKNRIAAEERKKQEKIAEEERKPPTESQANAANFANRMGETEKILTPLEEKGTSTANFWNRQAEAISGYLPSEDFRKYRQAQEDWVRAKLRRESGAVIGDDEMAREITTYFPQPGDTDAVIKQKREARETALKGVEGAAKPGFKAPRYKLAIPEGVLPEEWEVMTDEERALWQ